MIFLILKYLHQEIYNILLLFEIPIHQRDITIENSHVVTMSFSKEYFLIVERIL